jgi:urease accessory protein
MPARAGIHDLLAMIRAPKIARGGEWQTARAEITLDYDRRHRRRLRLQAGETEILLDLPEAIHIRHGDALALEDGTFIAVRAADEALLEIRAPDADTLTKLAWHLGNRHLAVEFRPGALRILHDHVIAEMITGLGGTATQISAPFDPESGAYAHD